MDTQHGKALGAQENRSQRKADIRNPRNQQVSSLLRLPEEIRNIIYEYALGGHHIYLSGHYHNSTKIIIRNLEGEEISKDHLFALGYSCRQIHSESAIMLFSLNDIFGWFWSKKESQRYELFSQSQRDAICKIGIMACCFKHFTSRELKIINEFGGLQRVTVVAAQRRRHEDEQIDAAYIDRVNREVQRLGREMEVVLKARKTLYK